MEMSKSGYLLKNATVEKIIVDALAHYFESKHKSISEPFYEN